MKYSGSSARAGEFREGQACGKYILESVIGRGVACVLYEMLTGRPPFLYSKVDGTTAEIALRSAHVNEKPIPPHELTPSIPPGISRIIMMALNKDPNGRPQGCAEFLRLLLAGFTGTRTVEVQKQAQKRWGRSFLIRLYALRGQRS